MPWFGASFRAGGVIISLSHYVRKIAADDFTRRHVAATFVTCVAVCRMMPRPLFFYR